MVSESKQLASLLYWDFYTFLVCLRTSSLTNVPVWCLECDCCTVLLSMDSGMFVNFYLIHIIVARTTPPVCERNDSWGAEN